MRITRSTLRRLIAEESARLLREAKKDDEVTVDWSGYKNIGKGPRDNNCLYITYGGRGVYYFVAKGGLDEREAVERGRDVTAELVGDEDVADPLSLYDWLQNHDQIEYVFDDESIGGFAEKHEFMEQLRGVGEEEGLFADDEFINEDDDLEEGAFPEEIEGVYGEEPPEFDEEFMGDDDSWMDYETGEDDVPYGAADVALRKGRGHRTDEGDDLYEGDSQGDDDFSAGDDDDYEHAYAMGGGSDEEGFAIDYDTGRPSPFAAKHLPKPRPAQDDVEGPDQDDVWGDDDMGRKGARDDYEHAWKMGGGRDEDGFAMDYDKLDEARWAKLAGILKG